VRICNCVVLFSFRPAYQADVSKEAGHNAPTDHRLALFAMAALNAKFDLFGIYVTDYRRAPQW
jgi:hypothetical protein